MSITFFSTMMSIILGTVLMILFSLLRKQRQMFDICSITGIVILYVLCAVRMLIPIELAPVRIVPLKLIYNPVYRFMKTELSGGLAVWMLLLAIWLGGSLFALVRLSLIYHRSGVLIRNIRMSSKHIESGVNGISRKERISIYQSCAVDVPVTFGLFHKTIVIPDNSYSEEEMELIINHEAAHIRNGDLAIQFLANILCVAYWWNPAVYVYRKNLEQYFELRCDRTVTAGMSKKEVADYLEILLKIYNGATDRTTEKTVGVAENYKVGGKELKERFEYLSSGMEKERTAHLGKKFALALSMILLIASYSFIFQSDYDIPADTYNTDEGGYEIDTENAYLIRSIDGSYRICDIYGFEQEVSEESAKMLMADGFVVK